MPNQKHSRRPSTNSSPSTSRLTFISDDAVPHEDMPQIPGVSRPGPATRTFQLAYRDSNGNWASGLHPGWRPGRLFREAQPFPPDTQGPRNPFATRESRPQPRTPSSVSAGQQSQASQGAGEKPQDPGKKKELGIAKSSPIDIGKPGCRDERARQSERDFERRLRCLSEEEAQLGEDVPDSRTRDWVEREQMKERQRWEEEKRRLASSRGKTASVSSDGWSDWIRGGEERSSF